MFLVYYLLNSKEIFSTYVLSLSENSSILDSMKICAVSNNNNNNNNLKISIEPLKYQKVNKWRLISKNNNGDLQIKTSKW